MPRELTSGTAATLRLIEWSDDDQVYVVSLPGWGDLIYTHGDTYEEALQRGKELVEGLVASRGPHAAARHHGG